MSNDAAGGAPAPSTVLFLLPWSPDHAGGVNTVVKALYGEAAREGAIAPLIGVNDWNAVTPAWDEHAALRVFRARIPPAPADGAGLAKYLWWFLRHGRALLRLLAHERVSAVNIHYPSSSAWFFVLARRLGLWRGRLVLSYHGLDIDAAAKLAGGERTRYLEALEHADAITTCSFALKRRLVQALGSAAERATAVHNGTDAASCVEPALVRERARAPVRIVLNVGTYENKKGQDVLLRAFARLAASNLRLRLIGRTAPALDSLRALAGELRIAERVEFLCDVSHAQTLEHCRAAHVFVSASREEPFGIAILEAGAAGLPVVATSVGGVVEFLNDGTNALLVGSEDVDAMAGRIGRLLNDAELRERLAVQLNADVRAKYTWSAAWRQYAQLLLP
ncbi:MAG: glycosyltransferase family 4 protein [Gammaproteobacteria bacterium]|nr:glycosyltransferase family 4 protein [Gammaproteobacteria bacterium]MBI5618365.1 glycosyltransferase family 4 protein [Gammaproteobacteria bacterium]